MDASVFKLYEKHTVTARPDTVSDEGMVIIRKFVADKYVVTLPDDFSADWTVGKAEISGNLPTRIKVLLKKKYGIKISPTDLSEIGNIGRRHTVKSEKFIFDLTDKFDWEDGDFGDGGSCYWNGRAGARKMLSDHDSLAIRFYAEEKCKCNCHFRDCENGHKNCDCGCHRQRYQYYCPTCKTLTDQSYCGTCETYLERGPFTEMLCIQCQQEHAKCGCNTVEPDKRNCCGEFHRTKPIEGMGRAWIVFPKKGDWKDTDLNKVDSAFDACAVYNAYGESLVTAGTVISKYLGGLPYNEVKLFNNGSTEGTLWINNSKCVVVGKDALKVGRVTLHWEDEDSVTCTGCGGIIDEDDRMTYGDDYYCQSCYSDRFGNCNRCNEDYDNNNLREIDGEYYCENCVDRHFTQCGDCEEYFAHTVEVHSGSVCASCAEEYTKCDHCGDLFDNTETIEDKEICESCRVELYKKCSQCGDFGLDVLCKRCGVKNEYQLA